MNSIVSVKELKELILKNEKLFPGDKLSKERLLQIAEKYSLSPYVLAVYIFDVDQIQYSDVNTKCKNTNNMIILKEKIPKAKEEALSKKDLIIKNENLKDEDLIDYARLREISVKYCIPEKILALNVFLITENSYNNLRLVEDYKARIILEEKINNIAVRNDEINKLRSEILKNENLRVGDKVSCQVLKYISKKYRIDELKLVYDIFGIKNSSYLCICRDENKNAIILKDFFTIKELEELKEKIILNENLGDLINLDELVRISHKYLINEQLLAKKILGLTQKQYYALVYSGGNVRLFKDVQKIRSKKILRKIRFRIFDQRKINYGDLISYESITEIQKSYSLNLDEILYIFGINKHAFATIKCDRSQKVIIKNIEYYKTASILSEILEKERFYTKEELQEICNINHIPFRFFYEYVIGRSNYKNFKNCEEILRTYGKIWIGNKKLTQIKKEYEEKNYKNNIYYYKYCNDNEYDKELIRDYYFLKIAEGYSSDIALRLTSKSYSIDKNVILNIIKNKDDKLVTKVLKVI